MNSKVTIITPAYNVANYIGEAIDSVLGQSYSNWELIIIDNNSSDNTEQVIKSYDDERIIYLKESQQGVSFARNRGLNQMTGQFLCFLDADDLLTPNSLSDRLKEFGEDPALSFVDGQVQFIDRDGKMIPGGYSPKFKGEPFSRLMLLDSTCFFGPTWMIKREWGQEYRFDEKMTHSEDLAFYLGIAKNRKYSYTDEVILHYRKSGGSAMSNLDGLERGYCQLLAQMRQDYPNDYSPLTKLKVMKIMFLSHLFDGKSMLKAIKALVTVSKS